jgi:hypothetical protein
MEDPRNCPECGNPACARCERMLDEAIAECRSKTTEPLSPVTQQEGR